MKITNKFLSCVRFEEILAKDSVTDEELKFWAEHLSSCPLGIHDYAAIERRNGWHPGTFQNWNGRDPLPASAPHTNESYLKRVWQVIKDTADPPQLVILDDAVATPVQETRVQPRRLSATPPGEMVADRTQGRKPTRRLACALLAARALAAASKKDDRSFATADVLTGQKPPGKRIEILSEIFKPKGRVACFAGDSRRLQQSDVNEWEAWKGHGFPNCRIPIRSYVTLFEGAFEAVNSDRELSADDQENVFSTGSPHASNLALDYLPFQDDRDGTFSAGAFVDASAIPYQFTILREEGWRVSPSLGKPEKEALKAIRVGGKEYSTRNEPGKYVTSDFLLVTRLRKRRGGHIILAAGGLGVGTRSFELLFDPRIFPDPQLGEVHRKLAGKECFQVLFKCTKFTHDGSTIAHRIELWDELGPVEIDPEKLIFRLDDTTPNI